jgi:hypothetical protein
VTARAPALRLELRNVRDRYGTGRAGILAGSVDIPTGSGHRVAFTSRVGHNLQCHPRPSYPQALLKSGEKDVNLFPLILALLVVVQYGVFPTACLAAAVNFTVGQSSSLNGQVPVHKIGNLLLAEGMALLDGSDVSVTAKNKDSKGTENILKGKLFKAAVAGAGKSTAVNGFAYFNAGSQLSSLEPRCTGESVDLSDGSKVTGPISDITQEAVSIASKTIPMSSVAAIHSSHVFNFSLKMNAPTSGGAVQGSPSSINFSSTCGHEAATKVSKSTSSATKKRIIIMTVVALGIATAISCGVAIPLATHHHHSNPTPPIFSSPPPPVTTAVFKPVIFQPHTVLSFNPVTAFNIAQNKFLVKNTNFYLAHIIGTTHQVLKTNPLPPNVAPGPPPPPPPKSPTFGIAFLAD